MKYIYREHAIQRMFERDILEADVEDTIQHGQIIEAYPDDKPFPSFLALKFFPEPLHVVFAADKKSEQTIVITAYRPDQEKWSNDYKKRIKK